MMTASFRATVTAARSKFKLALELEPLGPYFVFSIGAHEHHSRGLMQRAMQ
jgi:hypothetical protein